MGKIRNNKSKRTKAEVAASSTLPSQDSPKIRNDPPAREVSKPKEASGAPSNAYDLSEKEGTESSHGYLNQPSNLPDDSGNMVLTGFQPFLPPQPAVVQNASSGSNDETHTLHFKKRGGNKKKHKTKKTNAEVAANSTLQSQDLSSNDNDFPARNDGNKPKEAAGASSNAYDLSKKEGMESSNEYSNQLSDSIDGYGNMVPAGFQPILMIMAETNSLRFKRIRGNNKKNKSKKTNAEVAAKSMQESQESASDGNDPPAGDDGNQRKEAGEAPLNAYDPSKIEGTEVTLVIPDEYLHEPLYLSAGSRKKVQVGIRPVLPRSPAPPGHIDDKKNSLPAAVQPDESGVPKSPESKTKGVSTSAAQHGESSVQKFHDSKQKAEEAAKSLGNNCDWCFNEKQTLLAQAFRCEHRLCSFCQRANEKFYYHMAGPGAEVGCPYEECPGNSFPDRSQRWLWG